MRTKVLRLAVIAALLASSGAHLAAVQGYAWAAMTWRNLRAAAPAQALAQALDGKHPCRLCLKVGKESKSQRKKDARKLETKLDLFYQAAVLMTVSPKSVRLADVFDRLPVSPDLSPLVPPPKLLRA